MLQIIIKGDCEMSEALKGFIAFVILVVLVVGGVFCYYITEVNGTFRKNE